ncbi:MAG: pyruvate dehydrogenase complex dihydrolipoamide acetyltransferase [Chlamydiales bacterium]
MPFTFTMPKLSPTMDEGTVAKWHKQEGDYVEAGEVLLEVTTDKATVEHNALDEGWLRKILIQEGQTAHVNQPIAIFTAEETESIEEYTTKTIEAEPAEKEAPKEEEEAVVSKPPAPAAAPAFQQPQFVPEPPLEHYTFEGPSETAETRVKASPLARRLAKENSLDLTTVKGSGSGGRIVSKDLQQAQPIGLVTFGRREIPTIPPGTYEEAPLSPMRKIIARRLQESKTFIPHFYVKQTLNATPLVEMREQLKTFNLKISFNDMVIRACALALRQHPELNSGFNTANQTIIQFKTIDISVAVSIEAGLITPIIRNADYKNLGQISSESRRLAERARQNKLQEYEYKGGSFCVSNLGMYGITEFTAVINPPQAAILAVGGIEDQPIVKEERVIAGKTMVLTLSADHRVVDGAFAAQFLKTIQHLLENPISLVL